MITDIQQFKIRAASKLIAELRQGDYVDERSSAAVFCTDEPLKAPEIRKLPHCCLQFLDTKGPRAPGAFTQAQAAVIRDFIAALPEHITTLYCCCDWGQSRSAGLAAACMTALGQEYEAIFRNRSYTPNLLVYADMCEALGCGRPSGERLRELNRMRYASNKTRVSAAGGVKRILVVGDAGLLPAGAAETLGLPVELRGPGGQTIPHTEEELLADRKRMGAVFPGDLILVALGGRELRAGLAPEEIAARLRKYLLWLRYIYPGINVVLMLPQANPADAGTERLAELFGCCRALAEELQLVFVDASDRKQDPDDRTCITALQQAMP